MFCSLSAVNKDSVKAFAKLSILIGMSFGFEYNPNTRRLMSQWLLDCEPFFKRFKFPKKDMTYAVRAIVANTDPNDDQKLDDAITEFLWQLNDFKKEFHKELDIPKIELDLIDRVRLYGLKASDNAYNFLAKNVGYLKEPGISKIFITETVDTSDVQTELRALVKKYTGKPGMILPQDQLSDFVARHKKSGTRHADHDKYLKLRRELTAAYKARLASIVRASGKPYLPLRDVIAQLKSENVYNELPAQFVGNIGDDGKFYTTAGKLISTTISGEVRMNGTYDPQEDNGYVCEYTPPFAQGPTRAYTVDFKQHRTAKKFSVVQNIAGKIEKLTEKWLKDLRKAPRTQQSCLATICELVYATTGRIGNANASTDGKQTYGISQLRVKHVKIGANRIDIKYPGKSGIMQHHIIQLNTPRLKLLGQLLPKFVEDKKPTDYLVNFKGKPFSGAQVNRYLLSLGFPEGFTIHKLRTARGTQMAYELLQKAPFTAGSDAKAVNTWVENELLKVGTELGHMSGEKVTAATAIANYIDPGILDDFYRKINVRPSSKIQKAIDAIGKKDT